MNITVIHRLNDAQIEQLYQLYQQEWFTKGRSRENVHEMLKHTDFAFGFCPLDEHDLIGFARVISDWMYKAFVFDVIVDQRYRNKGIGEYIMNTIFNHPVLKSVSHIELYCPEKLAPFYEKMGFERRTSLLLRRTSKCSP